MNRNIISTGAALGGVALLAACACGAGGGIIKSFNSAGMATPNLVVFGASCGTDHSAQQLFIGVGALLILIGMSLRSLSAFALAAIGSAALMFGSLTTGPSAMNLGMATNADTSLFGYAAYIIAAGFLIAAFLRAFKTPKPIAAGAAMSGMALATGCSCCMITGATTALIANTGITGIYGFAYVLFAGGLLMVAGLWKLGGIKPALFTAAGVAVAYGGQSFLNMALPELIISGNNYRYVPGYAVYFLGAALMLGGFVVAYQIAAQHSFVEEPSTPAMSGAVPATGN